VMQQVPTGQASAREIALRALIPRPPQKAHPRLRFFRIGLAAFPASLSQDAALHPRVVDAELNELLGSAGAVGIEGPKACGKTITASQQALAVEPALVLEGAKPRLLDEWQLAPELWNQVRRAVDGSDQPGQLLLTGSAVPPDDANRHTGAGRFGFLRVRPMSLVETGVSGGALSLRHLFAGELQAKSDSGLTVQDLCALIARGGWPAH